MKIEKDKITHHSFILKEIDDSYTRLESDRKRDSVLESVVPLMTELKEVTTALEQARSEMHAMLNATSEAIMLLSAEDEILWLNQAFGRFFSIETRSISGDSFKSLESHWSKVFKDSRELLDLIEISKTDKSSDKRETLTQIWPQKRELEIYSAPVENANKEYLGQLFVFRDVTREREVERMKSEFVSLVSHEFRTPLTSIRGYTEMMLEGDVGELNEEQVDFLKTVFRNATHLQEIVNDLLIVSRLEAGAVKLNLEELSIRKRLDDAITLVQPQIDAKSQKLKIDVQSSIPDVRGDPQRISQILLNLISNANKYTPDGGTISIKVQEKKGFINIGIKDTGIGLSKEELNQLFTKFYRAENPETIKAGGTGLGLWITRSLVDMHGGEISVISKPGKGSTFTFTLPITKEP
jgi:signal transduction histidine kinase